MNGYDNIRLTIAYDGTAYGGWQRQQNRPTVQAAIEDGLAVILGERVVVHGAGRTDAGVHALAMVAAFNAGRDLPLSAYQKGLNSILPPDIRVVKAERAAPDFHPRFSARGKRYRYLFSTSGVMMPCQRLYRAHFPGPFALEPMLEALPLLEGEHDFSAFEATGSRERGSTGGRGAVRCLHQLNLWAEVAEAHLGRRGQRGQRGHNFCFEVSGDGFLRHMVRNMVGTLVEIGRGRRSPESIPELLASKDRTKAGATAPACGLTLVEVYY